jgi:hypothetical protein
MGGEFQGTQKGGGTEREEGRKEADEQPRRQLSAMHKNADVFNWGPNMFFVIFFYVNCPISSFSSFILVSPFYGA